MSGIRVTVTVLTLIDPPHFGDPPTARVKIRGTNSVIPIPADRIADAISVPAGELPGWTLKATMTETGGEITLTDFTTIHDPRA